MSSDGESTVAAKLFIDKEKKMVLFAESDQDFVDVLFSFLTLPLGTIVRRLGKQSQVGCLDQLYNSVEDLGEDHFQTKPCKTMLLSPRNAAAVHLDRLKVEVDGIDQTHFYACKRHMGYFSSVPDVGCPFCGTMDITIRECSEKDTLDEIFVQSRTKFIITDDLQVAPSSTALMFSLMDKLGLQEQANIEEVVLQLNSNKLPENFLAEQADEAEPMFKPIKIRIIQSKDGTSVLYAEVGHDFVDIFFSLLCIPIGSIIKAFGEWSPSGSIDNLYKSVNKEACVKQECQSLLLSPKLPPFFGCSSNVLQVEELPPRSVAYYNHEVNPKEPVRGGTCRAYIKKGSTNFMVTDDLHISNFSLANSLKAIRAAKIPKEKLVEKELTLGKTQVLKLLRAAMLTRGALAACSCLSSSIS
ncbi:hypothetical protein CFC21_025254 [Triticum aestivum]|uniref:DUF674 domain-containing protein n=2 Tax=Triticum aestivum TaxID=4565 RepID=A0A3B6CER6_WHEAT|nr:hypothetical protein CFC21_025254 [Triticum aestivum]